MAGSTGPIEDVVGGPRGTLAGGTGPKEDVAGGTNYGSGPGRAQLIGSGTATLLNR